MDKGKKVCEWMRRVGLVMRKTTNTCEGDADRKHYHHHNDRTLTISITLTPNQFRPISQVCIYTLTSSPSSFHSSPSPFLSPSFSTQPHAHPRGENFLASHSFDYILSCIFQSNVDNSIFAPSCMAARTNPKSMKLVEE